MQYLQARPVISPRDLRAAAECEWGLVLAADIALGRRPAPDEVAPDPLMERVAALGLAQEQRVLRALSARHPGGIRPGPTWAATLDALADPATQVIAQARIEGERFVGVADFLLRTPQGWVVADAKLAREESVTALLQVGAYAAALQAAGVTLAPFVRLLLGDGDSAIERDVPLDDLLPVVATRQERVLAVLDTHLEAEGPAQWDDPRWIACLRCPACREEAAQRDDVLTVHGVYAGQRGHLRDAGITTAGELATLDDAQVAAGAGGLGAERLRVMRTQAQLQRRSAESGELAWSVRDAAVLASLPAPSEGDVFFDFEGDPMWRRPGDDTRGLEYLFGCLLAPTSEHPEGERRAWWAHDRAGERAALVDFLDFLTERRRRWPDLHVYHYADYERAALLRLAARHGVGEGAVDDLLRGDVLVDLYSTVRHGLQIGSDSYSIKRLEPLYMGTELRDPDGVTGGGGSVVEYHRYVDALLDGDEATATAVLADIDQYNAYDCLSTLRLRDWLLARAGESQALGADEVDEEAAGESAGDGVGGEAPGDAAGMPATPDRFVRAEQLEQRLRALVGEHPRGSRTPEQQAIAMVGSAVQYHRREVKPFAWGHYDRLRRPVQEWLQTSDVLEVTSGEVREDWAVLSPRHKAPRRRVQLRGRLRGGSRELRPGGQLLAVYDAPVPQACRAEGLPRGTRSVEVLDVQQETAVDGSEEVVVLLEEGAKADCPTWESLPMALAPSWGPATTHVDAALAELAEQVADAAEEGSPLPMGPATDLLLRRPPRLRGGGPLPQVIGGDHVAAIGAAVERLDRSTLAVQGPPGTGKTYVGSRVIADLVLRLGWRVGVVAQSHAAVEGMLAAVAAAGVPEHQIGKRGGSGGSGPWTELGPKGAPDFLAARSEDGGAGSGATGRVLGGTMWDLTHPQRVHRGQLDLVVVDEAGQFAIAPTLAVSVAAPRLLLLGDPRQLDQVSQGTHDEPVDRSALGWLLDGSATMPSELGYFLERTWRMHPALTEPVSRLSYAGQLCSQESVTTARSLAGVAPGLHLLDVEHELRTTSSPEEAEAIVGLAEDLLGRAWTDGRAPARPLAQGDLLVITAYNHQVATIRATLDRADLGGIRVGTVDKLQGQEAPVVIVSMVASSAHDISRGLRFLLHRNRLNVAISRGQHAAYLVMSPRLADAAPRSVRELLALGAFLGLRGAAQR